MSLDNSCQAPKSLCDDQGNFAEINQGNFVYFAPLSSGACYASNKMFEKLLAHRDHLPPHRIWDLLNDVVVTIEQGEFVHLLLCADCRQFVQASLRAGSFGEALGIWLAENEFDKAS